MPQSSFVRELWVSDAVRPSSKLPHWDIWFPYNSLCTQRRRKLPAPIEFLFKNLSLRTLRLFGSLWCQQDQSYKRGSGRNILFWLKRLAMCSNVFRALWLWLFFVINPAAINNQWSNRCRRFKVMVGPNFKPICRSSICRLWHRRVEVYGNKVLA